MIATLLLLLAPVALEAAWTAASSMARARKRRLAERRAWLDYLEARHGKGGRR